MRERRRRPSGTISSLAAVQRPSATSSPAPKPIRATMACARPTGWRYGSAVMTRKECSARLSTLRPAARSSSPASASHVRASVSATGSPTSMIVARPVTTAVASGSGSASRRRRRAARRRRSGAPSVANTSTCGWGRWVRCRARRGTAPGTARPAGRAPTAARPARSGTDSRTRSPARHITWAPAVRGDQWLCLVWIAYLLGAIGTTGSGIWLMRLISWIH